MKKLYNDEPVKINKQVIDKGPSLESLSLEIDKGFDELDVQFKTYDKLDNLHSSICSEERYLQSPTNRLIFNEYLTNLQSNLGVDIKGMIATEELNNPVLVQHHQIAMEGIIGKIWEGIKKMFEAIGNAIKDFFKRFFTRLGRVKARLENLEKTIVKTDKDIKQLHLDKVPSAIKRAFPYSDTLYEANVGKMVALGNDIYNSLKVINEGAEKLAGADILDKDFIASMKAYRDTNAAAQDGKSSAVGSAVSNMSVKAGLAQRDTNKKLSDVKKEADANIAKGEKELSSIVDSNTGSEDEDTGAIKAKQELVAYFRKIVVSFKPLIDQPLPNGEILKSVEIDTEGNVTIDKEKNSDVPSDCSLGSKATLLKIVRLSLKYIIDTEKLTEKVVKVNDLVDKRVNDVNKLIGDLDKSSENLAGQYKKILQNKVKVRLGLLKDFYGNYSKFNKNLLEMTVNIGDGVIVYSTESLKRFG